MSRKSQIKTPQPETVSDKTAPSTLLTCHTKATPEFQYEIRDLIHSLEELNHKLVNQRGLTRGQAEIFAIDVMHAIGILDKYTTNSPCVVNARPDEPIFTLRGQDRFSAALVMAWAQLFDEIASATINKDAAWTGTPRSGDAMDCAFQMAQYHTRKFPD